MKVLFAGPSIYGLDLDLTGITLLGPAALGDIARAVTAGATAIGLVDGNFEAVAAVWHKEIVLALAHGVAVFGSSSMGALRAAECAPLGMIPIGAIAEAYVSGALDDDAAVALQHGPKELGYPPCTEPLVDVFPTLEKLARMGLISAAEEAQLRRTAERLHFKDRTDEAVFAPTNLPGMLAAYRQHRVNRKGEDALLLVDALRNATGRRVPAPTEGQGSSFFSRAVLPGLASAGEPASAKG